MGEDSLRLVSTCSALLALLLLACGDGEGDDGASGDAQPTTAAAAQRTATAPPSSTSRPAGTQATSTLDVCSLLTKAEVEAAVRGTVLDPRASVEIPGTSSACSFNSPQFPSLQVVRVTYFTGSETAIRGIFAPGPNDMKISGIGEDAYWSEILGTLSILKGRYNVDVQVTDAGGAVTRANRLSVARELAPKALARVP